MEINGENATGYGGIESIWLLCMDGFERTAAYALAW